MNSTGCPHRPLLLVPNGSCNSQVDHAAVFSGDSEDESGARDCKNTKDTKWDSDFPRGCGSKLLSYMLSSVEDFKWEDWGPNPLLK